MDNVNANATNYNPPVDGMHDARRTRESRGAAHRETMFAQKCEQSQACSHAKAERASVSGTEEFAGAQKAVGGYRRKFDRPVVVGDPDKNLGSSIRFYGAAPHILRKIPALRPGDAIFILWRSVNKQKSTVEDDPAKKNGGPWAGFLAQT